MAAAAYRRIMARDAPAAFRADSQSPLAIRMRWHIFAHGAGATGCCGDVVRPCCDLRMGIRNGQPHANTVEQRQVGYVVPGMGHPFGRDAGHVAQCAQRSRLVFDALVDVGDSEFAGTPGRGLGRPAADDGDGNPGCLQHLDRRAVLRVEGLEFRGARGGTPRRKGARGVPLAPSEA